MIWGPSYETPLDIRKGTGRLVTLFLKTLKKTSLKFKITFHRTQERSYEFTSWWCEHVSSYDGLQDSWLSHVVMCGETISGEGSHAKIRWWISFLFFDMKSYNIWFISCWDFFKKRGERGNNFQISQIECKVNNGLQEVRTREELWITVRETIIMQYFFETIPMTYCRVDMRPSRVLSLFSDVM